MLMAALAQMGIAHTTLYHTPDELGPCCDTLSKALQNNDVLLVSGGISVGDHDHVYAALKELQVTGLFHKVRQKPGKPLFFGKKGQKAIFALPGNPASALCCFYIYAYPLLQKSMGLPGKGLPEREGNCTAFIANTPGRAQFLTARWKEDGRVEPLAGQGPVGLQAFGLANALIFVPDTLAQVEKGERVRTFLLPY
jgi:molybdopterin molybdotransferase